MTATKQTITIEQGATFDDTIAVHQPAPVGTPAADLLVFDLAGYDVRMHIRPTVADTDPSPEPLLALTLANGRITVTAPNLIRRRIEAADTAALNFDAAVYDLELQAPDGTVARPLQGSVKLSREVTRG